MTYDIISSGSAVWDVFVETGLPERKGYVAYPVGDKILVKHYESHIGGSGVNASVSMARLGMKTAYLGMTGDDHYADVIIKMLKKEKIAPLVKRSKKVQTGYSVVLPTKEHNRVILTYKGANAEMKLSDIPLNKIKAKYIYLTSMAYEAFKTQEKLVKILSKRKDIKIAWNPSNFQLMQGLSKLKYVFSKTHLLILNKAEAKTLIKKGNLHKELAKLGPKIVCITEGPKGSTTYDGKYLYVAKASKAKAVERTGAGDAFSAGFLAGLIKTNSIESAIQLATANSESVIKKKGAINGILTKQQVNSVLKKKPFKIIKKRA